MQAALRALLLVMLASFAMSAHSASKPILVLGDSLSAEYGLVHGTGWVALLQKKLAAQKIDTPVVNASISGETTSGGRTRLPALLAKHQPRIVIIELGANDALRGLSLAATQNNLRAMIDGAKKAGAQVLLVGMQIPPNYGIDYTQQFSALYPKLAKESKSALVPFMLTGVVEKPALFQADRIHPTAQAHPIILNNIWPPLKRLLTER
jgi:acyl-CoA thioesterase-1